MKTSAPLSVDTGRRPAFFSAHKLLPAAAALCWSFCARSADAPATPPPSAPTPAPAALIIDIQKPSPFPDVVQGRAAPPPRSRNEIDAILKRQAAPTDPAASAAPFKIVLCASAKDPGHSAPGFHDYPLWRERWAKILATAPNVLTETADRWPSAQQWSTAHSVVFFHDNPAWEGAKGADLDAFLARGGGLVLLHWSINAYRDGQPLLARLGRIWGAGARFRQGPTTLTYHPHAITDGFPSASSHVDEPYWLLPNTASNDLTVATSDEDGAPRPQAWTRTVGNGRIFICLPGHFTWTHDDPIYRLLVFRGICWSAQQPLHRLNGALFLGARLAAADPTPQK